MPDPGEIIRRLEPTLGRAAGAPAPLEGGITNRNFRVRFGDRDCVLRLPGKDTALLGIDREAERLASEQAAGSGSRRRWSPPVTATWSPSSSTAGRSPASDCEPRPIRRRWRCAPSMTRGCRCRRASGSPSCSTTTRGSSPSAAARSPTPTRTPACWRSASRLRCRSTIRSRATTICCPATSSQPRRARPRDPGRLGVRRDGTPDVRSRQPRGQQ